MDRIIRLFKGVGISDEERREVERESDGAEPRQREVPLSERDRDPALYYAIAARDWEKVEALLRVRTGLRYHKLNGCTVLHLAVQKAAPIHVIEHIIELGVDVNVTDSLALNTPLHYALRDNAPAEIVRTLIRKGADVNRPSIGSVTPLALGADANCSVASMAAALDNGARVDLFDDVHWTPLHRALSRNADPALVRLLLERGSDPNAIHPSESLTLLEYAIVYKVSDSNFRLLLCYGAKLTPAVHATIPQGFPSSYYRIFKKAELLLVLCAPGTIPRMVKGRSPLRMLPTDVLRTLGIFVFGKLA